MGPACSARETADPPRAALLAPCGPMPDEPQWAAPLESIESPDGESAAVFDIEAFLRTGQSMPPQLGALCRLWEAKRAGNAMPSRRDFMIEELGPWLGHLMLVDAIDGGRDFAYRVFGTWIADFLGYDLTGKPLSTLASPRQRAVSEEYNGVVATRRPHYVVGSSFLARRSTVVARAILPLSYTGCVVDQLLIGFYQSGARA